MSENHQRPGVAHPIPAQSDHHRLPEEPLSWWRTRPPGSFAWADLERLVEILTGLTPPQVPGWREAVDGNPAVSIAVAFACLPVGLLAPQQFDAVMTMVLRCALLGDRACAEMLVHVLGRRGRGRADLRLVQLAGAWRHSPACLLDADPARTTAKGR